MSLVEPTKLTRCASVLLHQVEGAEPHSPGYQQLARNVTPRAALTESSRTPAIPLKIVYHFHI